MQEELNAVPLSISNQTVTFNSNRDFQKGYETRNADSATFLKYTNKRWVQPKFDQRITREVISTLLAPNDGGDDCVDDSIEKLLAEDIAYSDLASLTQADLEAIGIKDKTQQEDLLAFLQLLPNQDPSYASILKTAKAATYNSKIFNCAANHLETMRCALTVASYKLQIMPADDVIVGEKSFASKFVIEALSELKGLTDEIDTQLTELDELVTGNGNENAPKNDHKSSIAWWILLSSVTTGTLVAMCFWKYSK